MTTHLLCGNGVYNVLSIYCIPFSSDGLMKQKGKTTFIQPIEKLVKVDKMVFVCANILCVSALNFQSESFPFCVRIAIQAENISLLHRIMGNRLLRQLYYNAKAPM